jgi:hypothetical protein
MGVQKLRKGVVVWDKKCMKVWGKAMELTLYGEAIRAENK